MVTNPLLFNVPMVVKFEPTNSIIADGLLLRELISEGRLPELRIFREIYENENT